MNEQLAQFVAEARDLLALERRTDDEVAAFGDGMEVTSSR